MTTTRTASDIITIAEPKRGTRYEMATCSNCGATIKRLHADSPWAHPDSGYVQCGR